MGVSTEFFPVQLQARLLFEPGFSPNPPYAALALHGYGQTPEIMLALTRKLLGPAPAIAALAAPHQHYSQLGAGAHCVYNWGTRDHWPEAIAVHHDMVNHALHRLTALTGLPAQRLLLAGFSQPVGLGYRYALAHPGRVGAVLGLCGGVPGDWETLPGGPVTAALMHISRSEDEFYPAQQVEKFAARLRTRASDVEYHLLPGPHRFPSQAGDVVTPWLERLGLLQSP